MTTFHTIEKFCYVEILACNSGPGTRATPFLQAKMLQWGRRVLAYLAFDDECAAAIASDEVRCAAFHVGAAVNLDDFGAGGGKFFFDPFDEG